MSKRRPPMNTKKRKHATTKTCDGKVRYRDMAEANAALQRLSQSSRDKKVQRAYHCDMCGGVHLTGMYLKPRHSDLPDEFVHFLDDTLPLSHREGGWSG